MTTDGELRELFARKAEGMEINRSMPSELVKRARRRQGLIALASTATMLTLVVAVWIGAGPWSRSEAISPSDNNGVPAEDENGIEGQAPTADRLAGIWLRDPGPNLEEGLMLRIGRDGTAAFASEGLLAETPWVRATYVTDGNDVTFTVVRERPDDACVPGDNWTWRTGIQDEGRMQILNIEDGTSYYCSIGLGTRLSFTRVSPISQTGAQITAEDPAGKGFPPESSSLEGIWLEEGSGRLLSLYWAQTYSIDDGGLLDTRPDDAGDFQIDDRGTLTFTSGSDSRACEQGAVTVWKRVRLSGRTLRGTVAKDECTDSVGAELTWILLSP
jgi:hypothetical protein